MSCSPLFGDTETPLATLEQRVCGPGATGWSGPGAGARLLSACLSKRLCLLVDLLPLPPPLGPSSLYLQSKFRRKPVWLTWVAALFLTGQSLASGVVEQPVNWPLLDQCLLLPPREWSSQHASPSCSDTGAVTTPVYSAWGGAGFDGYLLADALMWYKLSGSREMVWFMFWIKIGKTVTSNGRSFLRSLLDKIGSELYDFCQGQKLSLNRVACVLKRDKRISSLQEILLKL